MNWEYYNPFSRFRLLKDCWNLSLRVKSKLEKENIGSSPTRLSICFDYLIGWLKHGFSIVQYEDYDIYKLKDCIRKNIVTNRRALKLEKVFNDPNALKWLVDKGLFNTRFKKYVKRDWFFSTDVSEEEFCQKIDTLGEVMVKPIDGTQGKGIFKIKAAEHDLKQLYQDLSNRKVLIEEVIKQHPDISFGRKSVNTIRMYTLLDSSGKAHLLKCVLRVGAPGKDVDNYHQGGTIWPLNRQEGFIETQGKSLASTKPINYLEPQHQFMLGYRLPNYEKAVDAVLNAAKLIPDVRYVGWDVAVTPDGVEIIEANSSPDNDFHCLGCEKNYYSKLINMA